jgi:GR25 family glycosyltransferase involved in LPS biosynthesis
MNIYFVHEDIPSFLPRANNIKTQLAELRGDYHVHWVTSFPAVEFNESNDSKFNRMHTSPKASEKSCFWKHYDALRLVAQSNEVGLIIEDDAVFKPSLIEKCQGLLKSKSLTEPLYINIEYSSYDVPLWLIFKDVVKMKGTKRCGAYIVSPQAAQLICDSIMGKVDNSEVIGAPSDTYITHFYQEIGINTYWAVHPLVWQGSKTGRFKSDLSGRKQNAIFKLYEPITFYVMPFINKLRAVFRKKVRERVL